MTRVAAKDTLAAKDEAWFFEMCAKQAKKVCRRNPEMTEDAAAAAHIAAWKSYQAGKPRPLVTLDAFQGAFGFLRGEIGYTTQAIEGGKRQSVYGGKRTLPLGSCDEAGDVVKNLYPADDQYADFLSTGGFLWLLGKLPSLYHREIMWLIYGEERTNAETAKMLSVSHSWISKVNAQALTRLRALPEVQEYVDEAGVSLLADK